MGSTAVGRYGLPIPQVLPGSDLPAVGVVLGPQRSPLHVSPRQAGLSDCLRPHPFLLYLHPCLLPSVSPHRQADLHHAVLDDQDSDLVRRLMGQRDEANSALQVRNGSGMWNAHSGAGLVDSPDGVECAPGECTYRGGDGGRPASSLTTRRSAGGSVTPVGQGERDGTAEGRAGAALSRERSSRGQRWRNQRSACVGRACVAPAAQRPAPGGGPTGGGPA